jgi:dihydroflavonol-4-reductase
MKETIYLVTGAAGFLGINVSETLIARGKKVRALVLEGDPAEKHLPAGVDIVHGNLLNTRKINNVFGLQPCPE